ncbi:MAG: site-2 protease family protein, partial [Candidatus Diapherotrites archaeon]|nr:site-2 protease family protein [Candidatus Diapherotrites archaeon]
LKALSAGPAANLVVAVSAILIGLILAFALTPALNATHDALVTSVAVASVSSAHGICGEGDVTGASIAGVQPDWTVVSVNGEPIRYLTDLFTFLGAEHAGETINVTFTDSDGVEIDKAITLHGETGLMGVKLREVNSEPYPLWFAAVAFVFSLLNWMWILNLMVGLFNYLPLGPLDGGRIQGELFAETFHKRLGMSKKKLEKKVKVFFLIALLFLLVVNALPWFVP